jgi:uncharacterized protein YprB with RNaseH-like and TPR domain
MLRHSFCLVPGISLRAERLLWAGGTYTWRDMEDAGSGMGTQEERGLFRYHVEDLRRAMQESDLRFFADRLPASEQWRLFRDFQDRAVYLDIETTGMGRGDDHITTIVTYDGQELRHFVYGNNLDEFPAFMESVGMVVTYNGKSFDLPFIHRQFGASFAPVHLDLRYILKSVGIQGGLKKCERQLGLDRGELDGVDGYMAVLLWREFQRTRNVRALETLLAYNALDVLNLEPLMIAAFNRKVAHLPFGRDLVIAMPRWQPSSPHTPDVGLVERLWGVVDAHRPW